MLDQVPSESRVTRENAFTLSGRGRTRERERSGGELTGLAILGVGRPEKSRGTYVVRTVDPEDMMPTLSAISRESFAGSKP